MESNESNKQRRNKLIDTENRLTAVGWGTGDGVKYLIETDISMVVTRGEAGLGQVEGGTG